MVSYQPENGTLKASLLGSEIAYSRSPQGPIQLDAALNELETESAVKEAVHLIREGKDNDQPCRRVKHVMIAYAIVHHPLYYWIHFLSTLALMTLAFWEQEAVSREENTLEEKAVYLTIEMLLLLLIGFNFVLNFLWRGPKAFIKSRSILIILVLCVMFMEALAILSRNQRHFRVTRALRPLLLLDTHLMVGARRIIRQIIRCGKYIIDVLLILFFLIALAALISYYLFADTDPTYFEDLSLSFVSSFITMTTANHPDVFMEAYLRNAATPIFFVVFFIVTSYCFINLLAVVIVKFKDEAELKYKSLYLHRRKALLSAYRTLVKEQTGGGLTFNKFLQFMSSYQPQLVEHEVMCVYLDLQMDNPDIMRGLDEKEFLNLYQCLGLRWEFTDKNREVVYWYKYNNLPQKLKTFMSKIHFVMNHWLFSIFMMLCILGNLILLIVPTAFYTSTCPAGDKQFCIAQSHGGLAGSFLFTILYVLEVTTRLVLEGLRRYLRKWWNWFDIAVIYGALICLCVEGVLLQDDLEDDPFWLRYLVIVRPLTLIRLLRLRRSYFHLVKIMSALSYRLSSIFFLMMCVFYSYAIVGMEVFGSEDTTVYPGCCMNASYHVGEYFAANRTSQASPNVYWLNNFESLYAAFVTLYELMVVNNWFVIMEGFVTTTSWAARIYFILFWVANIIVINVSTAYILDGFELFYIDLAEKQKFGNHTFSGLKKHIWVRVTSADKSVLSEAVISFKDKREYSWRRYSPVNFILWWKRRSFNKQDLSKPQELHGAKPLSDYDIGAFKYRSKLQEWEDQQDEKMKKTELVSFVISKEEIKNWAKNTMIEVAQKAKDATLYIFT